MKIHFDGHSLDDLEVIQRDIGVKNPSNAARYAISKVANQIRSGDKNTVERNRNQRRHLRNKVNE